MTLWSLYDLRNYLKCGKNTAYRIGKESGARIEVTVGVIRYDPDKVKQYLEVRNAKSNP